MKKVTSLMMALVLISTTMFAFTSANTPAETLGKKLTSIVKHILTTNTYQKTEKLLVKKMISDCAIHHKNAETQQACEITQKEIETLTGETITSRYP
jgi:lactam utilization protein B